MFAPITQFFFVDGLHCLPKDYQSFDDTEFLMTTDESAKKIQKNNSQISIFGKKLVEKLEHSRVFLAGLDGIGCEILKCFALMGVGTAKPPGNGWSQQVHRTDGGAIVVADSSVVTQEDMDSQIFFGVTDLGKEKVSAIVEKVKLLNIDCQIIPTFTKFADVEDENPLLKDVHLAVGALNGFQKKAKLDEKIVLSQISCIDAGK
jgi:ubiquitin-activating enzyme E1